MMWMDTPLDQSERACIEQSCHGNFRRRIVFRNRASWQRNGYLQRSYSLCAETYFLMVKVS